MPWTETGVSASAIGRGRPHAVLGRMIDAAVGSAAADDAAKNGAI
jgi:hypothetical protein